MKLTRWIQMFSVVGAALLLCPAAPAEARVKVVAATQDLAWVAEAIGGREAQVDYLALSTQDPHLIEPRPSMVVKLRQADMLVRVGMDLDLWVDALIVASANSRIGLNGRGFVDCSRGIKPLQVPSRKIDPSQGDIHVFGNPHYFFGPSNLPMVARNVLDGYLRVDSSKTEYYQANYEKLMDQLKAALPQWRAKLAPHRKKGVVAYHQSLIYFLTDFGLVEAGNVEPRPGLEPTPGHIRSLAKDMQRDGVKVIIAETFRPKRFTNLLQRESGARVVLIPGGIGGEKGIDDYFKFIGTMVDRLAAAL